MYKYYCESYTKGENGEHDYYIIDAWHESNIREARRHAKCDLRNGLDKVTIFRVISENEVMREITSIEVYEK